MAVDETTSLAALAGALARLRRERLEDLYLERVHEVLWRRDGGKLRQEILRREGAAARADGMLRSTDGTDRLAIAGILDVGARWLPRLVLPPFAAPPDGGDWLEDQPRAVTAVFWRWSWAAVVRPEGFAVAARPALAETRLVDGRRSLSTWPPPIVGPAVPLPAERVRVERGTASLLFAPAAAATLVHELVGHRCEADDIPTAGVSPVGMRLFSLPLTVDDDPTDTHLPGAFSADDEGGAAHRRRLVSDGVITDLLADRQAAKRLGLAAGNARRGNVHSRPRPRISNLITSGPRTPLDELRRAASIEVLAVSAATFESASATVWLTVDRACLLHRGRRCAVLAPFTVRGSLAGTRDGLTALGGEAEASAEPGWCRKHGEALATGAVTPWLLLEGVDVR